MADTPTHLTVVFAPEVWGKGRAKKRRVTIPLTEDQRGAVIPLPGEVVQLAYLEIDPPDEEG